jgi:hypothetical protein
MKSDEQKEFTFLIHRVRTAVSHMSSLADSLEAGGDYRTPLKLKGIAGLACSVEDLVKQALNSVALRERDDDEKRER